MTDLVIFGTGDIARLAHYYFSTDSPFRVIAFAVDAAYRQGDEFLGLPLVDFESVEERFPPTACQFFVALSYAKMNRLRAERYADSIAKGYVLASYVSSRCTWLAGTPPGDNCFILEDNTVQPFVTIGNNVTLWSGNHIGHDSVIEDHCFLASQIVVSGRVRIRSYCFIGVNATLRNAITIAPGTLIGAGAIIMKDTVENGVYVPRRAELLPGRNSFEIEL
jgi:sugar O-acyltransferase (sialic acid O-acetyltransferase NeuD family)